MAIDLTKRCDIGLDVFYRVAWKGEPVTISAPAQRTISSAREHFVALLERDKGTHIYGVTTKVGAGAGTVLSSTELARQARRSTRAAGVSFGEPFPQRVTRGFVLARLANYLEGTSGVSLPVALAVASMLDGRPLPDIPARGNGCSGEISALSHLFADISRTVKLGPKDNGALNNGSPCAAALIADAALSAERRLNMAIEIFALAIEGFSAPLEHYDPVLGTFWQNPHETVILRALQKMLTGANQDRRTYQAPVSYRIIPRILGQAQHAAAEARTIAERSLSAVSDNPIYIPPGIDSRVDTNDPHGRIIHNGGFHNPAAYISLDALAGAWADLSLIAERCTARLLEGSISNLPDGLLGEAQEDTVRYLPCAQIGFVEQSRRAAQKILIPTSDSGGQGQTDVMNPVFTAWRSERECADCLVNCLAILALVSVQALEVTGRDPAPGLARLAGQVRTIVKPLPEARVLGRELPALADFLNASIFDTT